LLEPKWLEPKWLEPKWPGPMAHGGPAWPRRFLEGEEDPPQQGAVESKHSVQHLLAVQNSTHGRTAPPPAPAQKKKGEEAEEGGPTLGLEPVVVWI